MKAAEIKFWRAEMASLDTLYEERQRQAKDLVEMFDLEFRRRVRDLKQTELMKVSEFQPVVREVVATVAFNYPRLFFEVTDDEVQDVEGIDVESLLERASKSLFEITDTKAHVQQSIVDALFCRLGKIGIDINPPGDDIIAPWSANDPDAEDLVSFNRRPPFFVHLDPTLPPHQFGHGRYVREKMWVPLKYLKDDKSIQHRDKIKATGKGGDDKLGFGETMDDARTMPAEQKALQEAIENGEFVLVDRIHCRTHVPGSESKKDPRRLIMFSPGVDEPIKEVPHPFMRRAYTQRTQLGADPETGEWGEQPMFDETGDPIVDLETKHADGEIGTPARGWLVQHGFPFVITKLDVHPMSYYPNAHLSYLKDLQDGVIESLSRSSSQLKRGSRFIIANESEKEGAQEAGVGDAVRRAEDGEIVFVPNKDNWKEADWGGPSQGQQQHEELLRFHIDRFARTRQIQDTGGMTATQAALIGAAAEVNEQWGEAAVSEVYTSMARSAFTIMGDYRYTPEAFQQNVAPDGQRRFTRTLRTSDFLWKYRISVQAGSMQPLFKQLQQDKFLAFFDRAIQLTDVFDRRELAKQMAEGFDVADVEKLMIDDVNPAEQRAQQLENVLIVTQFQDPGVLPEQDHQAHLQILPEYRNHEQYQELAIRSQQMSFDGRPADPHAALALQQIDTLAFQHQQAHEQALAERQAQTQGRPASVGGGDVPQGIIGQVRSNAQETAQAAEAEFRQEQQT